MLRLFNLLRQWREEKREQAARPPDHCGDGDEAGSAVDDGHHSDGDDDDNFGNGGCIDDYVKDACQTLRPDSPKEEDEKSR